MDVSPWQGGVPHLRASLPTHSRFLRFGSGVTSAYLLADSMAAELLFPLTFSNIGGSRTCVTVFDRQEP